MYGFNDLLAILFLGLVFYVLGFRIVRRSRSSEVDSHPQSDASDTMLRRQILLDALNEPPYTQVLSPRQRDRLHHSLLHPGDTWIELEPVADFEFTDPPPSTQQGSAFVPPTRASSPVLASSNEPILEEGTVASTSTKVTVQPRPTPLVDSIRANWDPAVMMLYLGALLVVVAGLIFATYNWGTLGGWQKLWMLASVTIAFLVAGFAIRNIDRVKPASTTFIIIGGLLVPANFLAAYTVFDDVAPAMPLFIGAVTTTVVHALLSYQPGARLFKFSTVGAAIIALATIPAALGSAAGWGGVLGPVVIAMLPEYLPGLRRFHQPWNVISRGAVAPLAGFAIFQGWGSNGWMVAAALVGVSMVATRFSHRYPEHRPYLLTLADAALIAASAQIAYNVEGERWIIAAALFALALVLLKRSYTWPPLASLLQFAAAWATALLAVEITHELTDPDWAFSVGATVLTIGMLIHAQIHSRHAWASEFVAAWALPAAVASGVWASQESWWWLPVGSGALTLTLIVHRIRHRVPGDLNLAIASLSDILAVVVAADLLGYADSSRNQIILLMVLGVALTSVANAVLPQFSSVSGWLKNLLRIESLLVFFAAGAIGYREPALALSIVILVMFWNIWVSRAAVWSAPMAGAIWIAFTDVMIPPGSSSEAGLYWYLAMTAVFAAIAWQLDHRSKNVEDHLHAGAYLWAIATLTSSIFVLDAFFNGIDKDSSVHNGITLIGAAGIHWLGYRSNGGRVLLILAGFLSLTGLVAFTFVGVTGTQHLVLAIIALGVAGVLYRFASQVRIWIAFVLFVSGLVYIQLATDLPYSRDLLLGLVFAWILVSAAIVRWRSAETQWHTKQIFMQAVFLHPLAVVLPLIQQASEQPIRPDFVLMLVSLTGVVTTFGALRRSRELVLVGSAIGMFALLLQINIGAPGNVHAYTVQLSIYLIVVGMLLQRDPRIANTLLAAGSAVLVIPAMVEALSTGEIVWLWIALAEAVGLFLFGTVLRFRIPTAAGVIAVSVIALRMLVFAVSVVASWVSILTVGVALLIIGTMWLIFRDAMQARGKALFARWQSFD